MKLRNGLAHPSSGARSSNGAAPKTGLEGGPRSSRGGHSAPFSARIPNLPTKARAEGVPKSRNRRL
eukprot:734493-Alexandrium_andersonii.AAC.1